MEIFQSIQKNFAILGIDRKQLTEKRNTNDKNLLSLFLHGFFTIAYFLYLVRIANNFREYAAGIFETSAVLICGVSMIIIVRTMPKWFKLIDNLEEVINCSEYRICTTDSFKIHKKK